MSKTLGSEVHALWGCTECLWVKEAVVEFETGRDWISWSLFEQEHRPQHHCRQEGKPFLHFIQWIE